MTAERVKALQAWFAALDPETARAVRAVARQCSNCTHFEPRQNAPHVGRCHRNEPRIFGGGDSDFPEVFAGSRCGKWEDPQLPLAWSSPLSGVELDRAARAVSAEVPHG